MTRIALLLVTKLRVILTKISALPTRQSYVMTVVRPEERTFAVGVTHLVRITAINLRIPPFDKGGLGGI